MSRRGSPTPARPGRPSRSGRAGRAGVALAAAGVLLLGSGFSTTARWSDTASVQPQQRVESGRLDLQTRDNRVEVAPTGATSKQGRHTLAAGSSSSLCVDVDHSASGADLYRGHAGTDLEVRSMINGYSSPGTWTTAEQSVTHRLSVPVPRPTTPTATASSMCKPLLLGARYGVNWAWPTTSATTNAGVANTTFRVFARNRENTTWRVFNHSSYPQGWSGNASYTYPSTGLSPHFASTSGGLNIADDDDCIVIPNDGQSHTVSSSKYSSPIRTTYDNGTDWTTLASALVNR